jgi:hypothetical protein
LVKELFPNNEIFGISNALIYQAKEMEKQQIIDAHITGLIYPLEMEISKQAEQYFNETFKKK